MTVARILFAGPETGPDSGLGVIARMANRHGLVAGATGTGKTVTLQSLVEGFSRAGVPCFVADVKGDLSGLAAPGTPDSRAGLRLKDLGLPPAFAAAPTIFWDVYGQQGHPLRATASDIGPILFARLLNLTDIQAGVLQAVFRYCDDEGLLLIDLKDLRAALAHVGEQARTLRGEYGSMSPASVGAIQRALLTLEEQGGDVFLGEPALDLADLLLVDQAGRGAVNVLAAERLIRTPKLYAALLLWLLAELFERLPEVGDLDKPKLAFFFDEAHLLFTDAPAALVEQVEQVVRLIRSKGVGVYFVTQNPLDVPDRILGQLGTRVQHALRAFTPRDQKAVKTAAETFRPNPRVDVVRAIGELAVGEALISVLDEQGIPTPVERLPVRPPFSRVGPLSPEERASVIAASPLLGRYDQRVDRHSAYEAIMGDAATAAPQPAPGWDTPPASAPPPAWGGAPPPSAPPGASGGYAAPGGTMETGRRSPWGPSVLVAPAPPAAPSYAPPPVYAPQSQPQSQPPVFAPPPVLPPDPGAAGPGRTPRPRVSRPPTEAPRSGRETIWEAASKSAARNVAGEMGRQLGRQIFRGVLGSITGR